MAISMDMSTEERINLYRNEIQKRTPPVDKHDSFMLKVYQTLLDSALEELNQINQSEGQSRVESHN
jgi:hypothetical protein